MEYVSRRNVRQKEFSKLEDVIQDTDVLYMTRIQQERFTSKQEYDEVTNLFTN